MNQSQLYKLGKELLEQEKVEEAEIKAKMLLEFVLKQSRQDCIRNSLKEVLELQEKEYKEKIKEIVNGKPLQYITNKQEFMGLDFYVDENVLIPQPDTEVLVEQALFLISKISKEKLQTKQNIESINTNKKENMQILDLCTGSGAIAISIAKHVRSNNQNIKIFASDISIKALEVAKKNTIQNEVNNKVEFIQSDMFSKLTNCKFDIIVSNPPYIETSVIPTLSKEVRKEPLLALDGGEDGLDFYRIILEQSAQYLKPNGYVLFEIGYNQGRKILKLWEELKEKGKCNLNIINKEPIKDLAGNDRVMIFIKA